MRRTEYLILFGLDETATADDIRRAYGRRAKKLHPDFNSTPEAHDAFRALTQAYQALRLTTPRQLPVPVDPPPDGPPAPSSMPPPRAARARWAGATAFSISIVGALIAFNATFWQDDPAPRESGAKVSSAKPPIPPAPRADGPAATAAPAGIPPILMGRSTARAAKAAASAQSSAALAAAPTQKLPSRPAQAAPIAPRPIGPNRTQQIVRRPTIPPTAFPIRGAPVVRRVVPLARSTSTKVRPRERAFQGRYEPARPQTSAAPVPPQARPTPAQAPPVETLARSNLNRLLRSVLE